MRARVRARASDIEISHALDVYVETRLHWMGCWAPRSRKSKIWGQHRREILKFMIQVFPSKSDSEEIDSQWTFLRRTGHRAPRGPKSKIWSQNRRAILKFLIDDIFWEPDNEDVDGQQTFLYRTRRRAPRGPKSKIWGQNRREILKFLSHVFFWGIRQRRS